jgi:hypothetical protein
MASKYSLAGKIWSAQVPVRRDECVRSELPTAKRDWNRSVRTAIRPTARFFWRDQLDFLTLFERPSTMLLKRFLIYNTASKPSAC